MVMFCLICGISPDKDKRLMHIRDHGLSRYDCEKYRIYGTMDKELNIPFTNKRECPHCKEVTDTFLIWTSDSEKKRKLDGVTYFLIRCTTCRGLFFFYRFRENYQNCETIPEEGNFIKCIDCSHCHLADKLRKVYECNETNSFMVEESVNNYWECESYESK